MGIDETEKVNSHFACRLPAGFYYPFHVYVVHLNAQWIWQFFFSLDPLVQILFYSHMLSVALLFNGS